MKTMNLTELKEQGIGKYIIIHCHFPDGEFKFEKVPVKVVAFEKSEYQADGLLQISPVLGAHKNELFLTHCDGLLENFKVYDSEAEVLLAFEVMPRKK